MASTDVAAQVQGHGDAAPVYPWAKRTTIRGRSRDIVLCVRFSLDDSMVVVGHYDGTVACYDAQTFMVKFEFVVQPPATAVAPPSTMKGAEPKHRVPVTSISMRPGKPVMIITTTTGLVEKYDLRSVERIGQILEEDNEIYASDYSPNGAHYATAGRDAHVRVYDDATNDLARVFRLCPEYPTNAAPLRLFAVRFDPQDAHLLYSGGWSNTVHAHHMDESASHNPNGDHRHEFFGAYLTGDALDISRGKLVTASNRIQDVLQSWDLTTHKPTTIPWPTKHIFMPNCCRLSADARYMAVGGGGGLGLREGCFVLDLETHQLVVEAGFEKSVTACSFGGREALVAFGDGEGLVHLYENRFARK